tara:strand:- start:1498 stop:2109 length:612 start_codon:yes stop_codon:yes gene_type:complete
MSQQIQFPEFSGIRVLMMPFIQGDPSSVPADIRKNYSDILSSTFLTKGDVGFLTIDESRATKGNPHRGDRSKYGRALHTEAGVLPDKMYAWGGGGTCGWSGRPNVTLDADVQILLANNVDNSCAVWNATHANTSADGDIGDFAHDYPMESAIMMKAGEVHQIGILTPHESLPVAADVDRQFLRIMSSGVYGREPYFTRNPLMH